MNFMLLTGLTAFEAGKTSEQQKPKTHSTETCADNTGTHTQRHTQMTQRHTDSMET
jgi:hypothetical protein